MYIITKLNQTKPNCTWEEKPALRLTSELHNWNAHDVQHDDNKPRWLSSSISQFYTDDSISKHLSITITITIIPRRTIELNQRTNSSCVLCLTKESQLKSRVPFKEAAGKLDRVRLFMLHLSSSLRYPRLVVLASVCFEHQREKTKSNEFHFCLHYIVYYIIFSMQFCAFPLPNSLTT